MILLLIQYIQVKMLLEFLMEMENQGHYVVFGAMVLSIWRQVKEMLIGFLLRDLTQQRGWVGHERV